MNFPKENPCAEKEGIKTREQPFPRANTQSQSKRNTTLEETEVFAEALLFFNSVKRKWANNKFTTNHS